MLNENERCARLMHVAMALTFHILIHYFVVTLTTIKLIYIYSIAGEFLWLNSFHDKNNFNLGMSFENCRRRSCCISVVTKRSV